MNITTVAQKLFLLAVLPVSLALNSSIRYEQVHKFHFQNIHCFLPIAG